MKIKKFDFKTNRGNNNNYELFWFAVVRLCVCPDSLEVVLPDV
ncbi:MAG: hypothetical protein RAO94_12070 [Candidatus Stygibacter australis]|nr:hypothetical protein [Candidatus Stygibacter australis]MDP8323079.1 hypothetical protein [Candidatus Stygibacter australis]